MIKKTRGSLDKTIPIPEFVALVADMKECNKVFAALDRIKNTTMPFAYVNHLKIFMIIYFITLPIALAPSIGWGCILATFFVSYAMIGIEEIGVEIEEPFGNDHNDLPINDFFHTLKRDVSEILSYK